MRRYHVVLRDERDDPLAMQELDVPSYGPRAEGAPMRPAGSFLANALRLSSVQAWLRFADASPTRRCDRVSAGCATQEWPRVGAL